MSSVVLCWSKCSFTFVFEFVTEFVADRTCRPRNLLLHSTFQTERKCKQFSESQVCHQFEEAKTFALGRARIWENFSFFWYTCHWKKLPDKATQSCSQMRLQLTDVWASFAAHLQLGEKRVLFQANKSPLGRSNLLLQTTEGCYNLSNSPFKCSTSFHWQAQDMSNKITSPDMTATVCTAQTRTTWTPSLVVQLRLCVGRCAHAKYRNVARCVCCSLCRNYSAHQFCRSLRQPVTKCILVGNLVQRLAPQCLAFPQVRIIHCLGPLGTSVQLFFCRYSAWL